MKVYVSKECRERVNRESDATGLSNGQYVERLIWEDAHGRDKNAIETRLENKRDELKAAEKTVTTEKANVQRLEKEVADLQAELEKAEKQTDGYKDDIAELENRLESGERVFKNHPQIKRISEKYGKDVITVFKDVKDEFDDYPPVAFELSEPHEPTNWMEASKRGT